MKSAPFVAIGAIVLMTLSACSSSPSDKPTTAAAVNPPSSLVSSGMLTYGTAATFPPFEYQEGGKDTGFDIEMGNALAGYMGLQPSILDVDFDGLIPALKGGRVDIINSAMYINDDRAAQVDFIPYAVIGEAMLVPKGNKYNIKKIPDDLAGRTIAVTRGAIGETYMNEFNAELSSAGKKPMTILSLPTNQDALLAVKSGRADGFDTSTPGAAYTLTKEPDIEIAAIFKLGTKIGIAVAKGDTAMKESVTKALEKFVADGEYAKLLAKYNLPAETNIFN